MKPVSDWREGNHFADFRSACQTNDPGEVLKCLVALLGHYCKEQQYSSARRFSEALGNQLFAEQLTALRRAIDSPGQAWSADDLYCAVLDQLNEIHTNSASADQA